MGEFTSQEAADMLGISKKTLFRWVKSGKVPEVEKDWRGYRVWHEADIERAREYKTRRYQLKLPL